MDLETKLISESCPGYDMAEDEYGRSTFHYFAEEENICKDWKQSEHRSIHDGDVASRIRRGQTIYDGTEYPGLALNPTRDPPWFLRRLSAHHIYCVLVPQ